MKNLALRIDDIGASTKVHERYCESRWLNIGPLRDRRVFGAWGPYREMTAEEWLAVFELLEQFKAKITVAITAAWVEADGTLIPFPEKFPAELEALKRGVRSGLVEISGHGLTHCVLQDSLFLPRWWGSNRSYHREFWDWIPSETHFNHVQQSIKILQDAFGIALRTYVPPGNVYTDATLKACAEMGIAVVNCNNPKIKDGSGRLKVIGNEKVLAFHDRELVLYGVGWLRGKLESQGKETAYRFVGEL